MPAEADAHAHAQDGGSNSQDAQNGTYHSAGCLGAAYPIVNAFLLQGRSIIPAHTSVHHFFFKTKKITAYLPKRSNDADFSTLQPSDGFR